MRPRVFRSIALWTCLIIFGLSHSVAAGALVVCRDAHGGARVETGCEKSSSGECVRADESRAAPGGCTSHRCEDTPVQDQLPTIRAASRSQEQISLPILAPITGASFRPEIARDPPSGWTATLCGRPPDPLTRLRTVIILV